MSATYDAAHRPNGGHQPTMKRTADKDGADYYPTPFWATHALCEVEQFEGPIWEPACGDGAIRRVLWDRGYQSVTASDLYDRGHGITGVDFLTSNESFANIITNPPFHSAEQFVRAGVRQAKQKLCLLLRLAFLEGAGRADGLFKEHPPARVWIVPERITFYPSGIQTAGGGTMAYAWFVWQPGFQGDPIVKWIPTGIKARYSK
jgi:hypothetical protein